MFMTFQKESETMKWRQWLIKYICINSELLKKQDTHALVSLDALRKQRKKDDEKIHNSCSRGLKKRHSCKLLDKNKKTEFTVI